MSVRPVALMVGLALAGAAPLGLAAQTTATEKAAASAVMPRIDALQKEIQPDALAARLVGAGGADLDRIMTRVGEIWWGEMRDLSDHIGQNPETGFQEYESVDTLAAVLRARGWEVETGVADLETAFVAHWTSPAGADGPTMGIIVEYDALRGTTEDYHGCQHNAQSPLGFDAAWAVAEHMERANLPGRIKIYGTPAEEMGPPAKVTMHRAGVFDEADVLIRSHGAGQTSRNRPGFGVCCLNINMVRYIFKGIPAHQRQSWAGRNALSAAVQF